MLGDSIKGLRFPSTRRECPGKTTKVFLKKTTTSQPDPSEKMHGKAASNKGLAFLPYQQQQQQQNIQYVMPSDRFQAFQLRPQRFSGSTAS